MWERYVNFEGNVVELVETVAFRQDCVIRSIRFAIALTSGMNVVIPDHLVANRLQQYFGLINLQRSGWVDPQIRKVDEICIREMLDRIFLSEENVGKICRRYFGDYGFGLVRDSLRIDGLIRNGCEVILALSGHMLHVGLSSDGNKYVSLSDSNEVGKILLDKEGVPRLTPVGATL